MRNHGAYITYLSFSLFCYTFVPNEKGVFCFELSEGQKSVHLVSWSHEQ